MAEGNRPLAVKSPRIRAASREMMGDTFYCGEIRRLIVKA
jgi:hypothetical protein